MERTSCACSHCKGACRNKPGWLRFGDEKRIAEHLGITVKELFDQYLLVDFYAGTSVFVLSPGIKSQKPGGVFPFIPLGTCVFYKNGLCNIHEVAPHECQHYIHSMEGEQSVLLHTSCKDSWDNPEAQELIHSLLGYTPRRAYSIA